MRQERRRDPRSRLRHCSGRCFADNGTHNRILAPRRGRGCRPDYPRGRGALPRCGRFGVDRYYGREDIGRHLHGSDRESCPRHTVRLSVVSGNRRKQVLRQDAEPDDRQGKRHPRTVAPDAVARDDETALRGAYVVLGRRPLHAVAEAAKRRVAALRGQLRACGYDPLGQV